MVSSLYSSRKEHFTVYSASFASRMEKIWWMALGMTPADSVRSVPSLLFLAPPCNKEILYSAHILGTALTTPREGLQQHELSSITESREDSFMGICPAPDTQGTHKEARGR